MRKQRIQTARMSGQQLRAFGEGSLWPTKIRVDGAVGKRLARLGAGTEDGSVRPGRTPNLLCGACEPVGQHGGGGHAREPWSVAFEHERQTFDLPALLGTNPWTTNGVVERGKSPWRSCMRGARGSISPSGTRRSASGSPGPADGARPM